MCVVDYTEIGVWLVIGSELVMRLKLNLEMSLEMTRYLATRLAFSLAVREPDYS